MKYTISRKSRTSQFIEVNIKIENINTDNIALQIPAWRPGRYELGNFAANVKSFNVQNLGGENLKFQKTGKERWTIDCKGLSEIMVSYEYFAVKPDAGGCWLTPDVFYVNPIHCCMYVEGRENEQCIVNFAENEELEIATSLERKGQSVWVAASYDELVDSPILAAPKLNHESFTFQDTEYHIWIQGDCEPDWKRIKNDFIGFTKQQIEVMGKIPVREYHYLVLALPFKFYHGVEHLKSTVLALGPASKWMEESVYAEFIGVASHELFHVWNVKSFRPAEMTPYNYSRENYSKFGWIYEGITTYYGDLFLARSHFFNHDQYFDEIGKRLQKHLDNTGRFNYSISESSFDTWVDGYKAGIPGRRTSIYDEGSLISFILDMMIRRSSGKYSLDDFIREVNNSFGKANKGYDEKSIRAIILSLTDKNTLRIFWQLLEEPVSYIATLENHFDYLGLALIYTPNEKEHEHAAGIRLDDSKPHPKVVAIGQSSPAEIDGLMFGDEVTEMRMEGDYIEMEVMTYNKPRKLHIRLRESESYFPKVILRKQEFVTEKQKRAFDWWITGKNKS
ncbi:MAG: M61 family peptidase [Bacteroidia bacterium]|nr:M61 family metallopeptidase [Bacteroidia bacterium]MCZ2277064.1 M61 family peptidase [Bacteroidia bacterium]